MSIRVLGFRNPFSSERTELKIDPGKTYRELIAELDGKSPYARVLCEDKVISEERYDEAPEDGKLVIIRFIPEGGGGGGKDQSRWGWIIGALVFFVGSLTAQPWLQQLGLLMFVGGIGAEAGWFVPDAPEYGAPQPQALPMVRGSRNTARAWGTMPIVYGTHYVVPDLGAAPYTEIVGNDQYLRQLFVVGQAGLTLESLKIGETDIDSFNEVEYEVLPAGTPSTLYPGTVTEESIGITMKQGVEHTRTTEADTDEIVVDFAFPVGLCRFNDEGKKRGLGCYWAIEYRAVGSGTWLPFADEATVGLSARQIKTIRRSYRRTVTRGQYEVKVSRVTGDHEEDNQRLSTLQWLNLKSINGDAPISDYVLNNTVRVGLRIKATDQLQGVIDQFNCIATSHFPVYSGSGSGAASWASSAATSNPAAAMLWTLRGSLNGEPQLDADIDWPAFEDWYQFCETEGFEVNGYLTAAAVLSRTMAAIAAAGRAGPAEIDGKISIIIERERTNYVQHFSPRNSSNFSAEKIFRKIPHAAKIGFVNAEVGYQQDERIVYNDGYSEANATEFEKFDIAWVTDPDQIWRFGRYRFAEAKLRPEVMTIETDWENVACTRGDLVKFSHDIMLIGLTAGRVKNLVIDTGMVQAITVDEPCPMEAGKSYGIAVRQLDGGEVYPVATSEGQQTTLALVTPIAEASAPEVGDLFSFGESGSETIDCLILGIDPMSDLRARISMVEHAPDIYDADSGTIPEHETHITLPPNLPRLPAPPVILSLRADGTVLLPQSDGTFANRILLSIAPQDKEWVKIDHFEVECRLQPPAAPDEDDEPNDPGVDAVLEEVAEWDRDIMDGKATEFFINNVEELETYDVRIRAVSPDGYASDWSEDDVQVLGKIAPPQDIATLSATVREGGIEIAWSAVADKDLSHYVLKVGADWEAGSIIFEGFTRSYLWNVQTADTYHLMVKAVDTSGNESLTEADHDAVITAPGVVQNLTSQVVGNNVLVAWTAPITGSLQVAEYRVLRGATFAGATLIGTVSGKSYTIPEASIGENTYWIQAVDIAGNSGTESSINKTVTTLPVSGSQTSPLDVSLSAEGAYKAIVLRMDSQPDLVDFSHFEIQVSDDEEDWYPLGFDGVDWSSGSVDEWTVWPGTLCVHPVPHAGTTAEPVGRTLYYRARRVAKSSSKSDWEATISNASAQSSTISSGDIAANAITANKIAANAITTDKLVANALQALFADISGALTVGYEGSGSIADPDEGDRRIYIDGDEIAFQEYTGGAWSAVNSVKLGGADSGGNFAPFLACRGILSPVAEEENTEYIPGENFSYYALESDFVDHNGENELSPNSGYSFVTGKFSNGVRHTTTVFVQYRLALSIEWVGKATGICQWAYLTAARNFGWNVPTGLTYDDYISIYVYETYLRVAVKKGDVTVLDDTTTITGSFHNEWHLFGAVYDADEDELTVVVDNNKYVFSSLGGSWTVSPGDGDITPLWVPDAGSILDDLLIAVDDSADPDLFIQHYNHNVPWNPAATAKDIVLKPAEGGRVAGGPFNKMIAIFEDRKASGTNGGDAVSGSWMTRDLNAEVINTISGASLGSNLFTLPKGTYHIRASAPGRRVNSHTIKLYNETDSEDVVFGTVQMCYYSSSNSANTSSNTTSEIEHVFTISEEKTFSIQHRFQTSISSTGLGEAAAFGNDEIYTRVVIEKIG